MIFHIRTKDSATWTLKKCEENATKKQLFEKKLDVTPITTVCGVTHERDEKGVPVMTDWSFVEEMALRTGRVPGVCQKCVDLMLGVDTPTSDGVDVDNGGKVCNLIPSDQ